MYRHRSFCVNLTVAFCLLLLLVVTPDLQARVTTPQEAREVVAGWLSEDARPFGVRLGGDIAGVETFQGAAGESICYLVHLSPSGFVVVSADDLVEPIIAFTDAVDYVPSAEDPLNALVASDLLERFATVYRPSPGGLQTQSPTEPQMRWRELMHRASTTSGGIGILGRQALSDLRVAPLVKTRWSQSNACSSYCYNYYTPNHYLCGCVATAVAQLLYYHQYPTDGIGRRLFTIGVDGVNQLAYSRGGDGAGGPYSWDDMVLSPGCSVTTRQREAIGALCFDAGLAVHMEYEAPASSADAFAMAGAFRATFKFANAVNGASDGEDIGSGLIGMINPNLDAGLPVLLAILGTGGHAVVADGYGYDLTATTRTLYHHLNMGWARIGDMWYNLPNAGSYNAVVACVYNIFTEGKGEIVSGRVTDVLDQPVADAVVRARLGNKVYEAVTNDNGIYALAGVPSAVTFTIEVYKAGLAFTSLTVTTGTSDDWKSSAGNRWGVDFVATPISDSDGDNDVDFVDFAVLAGKPWSYPVLANFVTDWLIGVTATPVPAVESP